MKFPNLSRFVKLAALVKEKAKKVYFIVTALYNILYTQLFVKLLQSPLALSAIKITVAFLFIFSSLTILSRAFTPISSPPELSSALVRESAALGIKGAEAFLSGEYGLSSVKSNGNGYEITLRPSFVPTNATSLRHELYHIHAHSIEELTAEKDGWRRGFSWLVHELRAELYAVTGIRI